MRIPCSNLHTERLIEDIIILSRGSKQSTIQCLLGPSADTIPHGWKWPATRECTICSAVIVGGRVGWQKHPLACRGFGRGQSTCTTPSTSHGMLADCTADLTKSGRRPCCCIVQMPPWRSHAVCAFRVAAMLPALHTRAHCTSS